MGERSEPQFITDRPGIYSADRSLIAYPQSGQTYIERIGGERWVAPSEGRALAFSPDGTRIAWQVASSSANFDRRAVEVWAANVDGSEARVVIRLIGGGFSAWFTDGVRLLVSGRESPDDDPFLAAVHLADGSLTPIVRGPQLRGSRLSPAGGWLVYQVAFSGDPNADGLWVVRTDGSGNWRLEVYGAYRWRAEGRLLMIPLEPGAASQRLLEIDAASGQVRALTDPAVTPFRIAGGDWALSPEGNRVAFVSADDHNIWLIELTP